MSWGKLNSSTSVIVGINISYLIEEHELSFRVISRKAGLKESIVREIMRGNIEYMGVTLLKPLIKTLKVSIDDILDTGMKVRMIDKDIDYSKELKTLRMTNNYTLKELSVITGIPNTNLCQMEKGSDKYKVDRRKYYDIKKKISDHKLHIQQSNNDWMNLNIDDLKDFLVNDGYEVKGEDNVSLVPCFEGK